MPINWQLSRKRVSPLVSIPPSVTLWQPSHVWMCTSDVHCCCIYVSNELACQTDEVACVTQSQCLRHQERSQHCALWLKFTHSITVRTEGEGPVEYSPQTCPIWEQAIKIVSRLGALVTYGRVGAPKKKLLPLLPWTVSGPVQSNAS